MAENIKKSRRRAIMLGAAFTGAAVIGIQPAKAAASLSKAAVAYRDIPCNGRVCVQCVFFVFKPAAGVAPASRCKMVAGPINPAGWCEIWAPSAKI